MKERIVSEKRIKVGNSTEKKRGNLMDNNKEKLKTKQDDRANCARSQLCDCRHCGDLQDKNLLEI